MSIPIRSKEEGSAEAPKDDEPKQLTLDEFKKLQVRKVAALPAARKAGEGEDTSKWANAQQLTKDDDEDDSDKVCVSLCVYWYSFYIYKFVCLFRFFFFLSIDGVNGPLIVFLV